jgi:sulfonate transport system permease protein
VLRAGVITGVPLEDLSPGARTRTRDTARRRRAGWLIRLAVPVGLVAVWQVSVSAGWVSSFVLPSPAMVLGALRDLWSNGSLQSALPVSLERAGLGLFFGGGAGICLGVFAGLWEIGEELLDATLQMLRTVPFVALVPLFIAWFGIGQLPKITLIAAASFFPVYLNTYHAVRDTDVKLVEAGRTAGLTSRQIALRVVVPTALPGTLTGLRLACSMSLLALVLAEQVNATSGIGYLILNAENNERPDIEMAGVCVYAVLGIAADVAMRAVEHFALPWRPRAGL